MSDELLPLFVVFRVHDSSGAFSEKTGLTGAYIPQSDVFRVEQPILDRLLVHVSGDRSAGFERCDEGLEGILGPGRVLNNAKTEDPVEERLGEGHVVDVGLRQ